MTPRTLLAFALSVILTVSSAGASDDLVATAKAVKPSVVAIGTYQETRRPPAQFLGTGFAVADGTWLITNEHVLPDKLNQKEKEFLAIFVGRGRDARARSVTVVKTDPGHDTALLRLEGGEPLPALTLGREDQVQEGQSIAFTGFSIGTVLGLYAVTHRGIVSSLTPIARPLVSPQQLDARMIRTLQQPFTVFQLDATAYPGNSGSPLYLPDSGRVVGIISSVFVKQTKEKVISDPSGITYAIPIQFARELLREAGALR